MKNFENYKKDFPIFRSADYADMVYLDNAATTQRPEAVLEAEKLFYERANANPLRGLYGLAMEATDRYEDARETVRKFLNARSTKEIIFTRNATEALNLVAYSYGCHFLQEGDEILVSIAAHHSNLLPWQMVAARTGAKLKFLECLPDGSFPEETVRAMVNEHTKLVAVEAVSNVTGGRNQVELLTKLVHEQGGIIVLDGAQSVPHMPTDVTEMDVDFLAFSGHKMFSAFGIGCLYGKEELLDRMPPFLSGGEMIEYVTRESATYAELPHKFEAGTVNAGGAVSLAAAIRYIEAIGFEKIQAREEELVRLCFEKMKNLPYVHILGSGRPKEHLGILSFTIDEVHPHDIASILDMDQVYVRAGHHCAQPLMKHLQVPSSARASFAFYNDEEDVERFVESLQKVRGVMGYGAC